jgi:hypothetical protein
VQDPEFDHWHWKKKRHPNWERKSEMITVFRSHDRTCRKSPKAPLKKLLGLINEFSKAIRYKINLQKSVAFYTPRENYLK